MRRARDPAWQRGVILQGFLQGSTDPSLLPVMGLSVSSLRHVLIEVIRLRRVVAR
jgi:hypothetical protein